MPLLDHFRPPLSEQRHWEGFHSTWATVIAQQLNDELLPSGFFAEPLVRWARTVEIDVATFDRQESSGGVATVTWSPPQSAKKYGLDCASIDVAEVQVMTSVGGPNLVAAIELISPANKDRPSHRRAFAVKCVGYLQQGIAVVVVDIVTDRQQNLHEEILHLLSLSESGPEVSARLYAIAYRTTGGGENGTLEVWPHLLQLGGHLPTLPLWVTDETAVALDLEATYSAACRSLRIAMNAR
jgi:hypothetical protein